MKPFLVILCLLTLGAHASKAQTLTCTFQFTASGTLGTQAFTNVPITVTTVGTLANRQPALATFAPLTGYLLVNDSTSLSIAGVGTFQFIQGQTTTAVLTVGGTDLPQFDLLYTTVMGEGLLLATSSPSLSNGTWDMLTSIGPLSMLTMVNNSVPIFTNGGTILFAYDPPPFLPSIFQATVTAAQGPNITAITNGASFQPGLASNTWISVFGTNLASNTRTWNTSDFVGETLPTSLDGVSVHLSCVAQLNPCVSGPAYVEYISPTQINALVPTDSYSSLNASATAYDVTIVVTTGQGSSAPFQASRTEFALGFFTVGNNYIAARHADGTLVGKTNMLPSVVSRPAKPGETIALYGSGFGPTNPLSVWSDNYVLVTTPATLASCAWVPSVSGSEPCPVAVFFNPISGNAGNNTNIGVGAAYAEWAGLVESGLYQVNVTIPNMPDGDMSITAALGEICGISGSYGPCDTYGTEYLSVPTLISIQN